MQHIDSLTYEKLRAGDDEARRRVFEQYRDRIYAFCYRMTLDPDVASDVTQDVFVKVLGGIGSLRRAEAFHAWIFQIARNEVYALTRQRRETHPLRDDEVWETTTPIDTLLASERAGIVQKLLGSLRSEYREVLLLREFEGLSYAEIARVTVTSEGSVKARLFKARKVLLEKLKPIFGED
jgi:RNA polymerase sigma-70 factor (ECF subfamily)